MLRIVVAAVAAGCLAPRVVRGQSPTVPPSASGSDPVDAASATITAEDVDWALTFLASDALAGRDTPGPGLESAAAYLAGELGRMGLRPAGDDGGYVQRYPFTEYTLASDAATVRSTAQAPDPELELGVDAWAMPSEVRSATGVPVLIGRVDEDPLPAQVAGRIVVAFLAEDAGLTVLTLPKRAAEAGATGVLFVARPSTGPSDMAASAATLVRFPQPIPTVGILAEHAPGLLRSPTLAHHLVPYLEGHRTDPGPTVLDDLELTVSVRAESTEHRVPNVVALLPGSDPELRDEHIVVSAHFDHVGVGPPDATGDSIYNGADDNGSGTTAILEVAEAFASLPEPPARSVLFLAVSGEEKGILGSLWFAQHPTVPPGSMVANVNLDMVGRNAPDTLVALGSELTSMGAVAREAADAGDVGLTLIDDPDPSQNAFFRSDHVAFLRRDIPSIFFTAWLHADYHRPSDEADAVDDAKVARVGRLVFRLVHRLADDPEPPAWLGDGLAVVRERLKRSPF